MRMFSATEPAKMYGLCSTYEMQSRRSVRGMRSYGISFQVRVPSWHAPMS
jgi:hypothetical protein